MHVGDLRRAGLERTSLPAMSMAPWRAVTVGVSAAVVSPGGSPSASPAENGVASAYYVGKVGQCPS
ncbi:hypothetical protein [Dactylosporangium sp. CA-233914]|uniref:hypothetical protein n=1 Tax=Dactylosporangium sp. CA-233914 TaxID=3239934 RepID=UPI003D8BFEF4